MMKLRTRSAVVACIAATAALLSLPACTIPKLSADGNVWCYMPHGEPYGDYAYPDDAASREKLAAWLHYSESRCYSHMFFNWIPNMTVRLSDGTRVNFHPDFVHIETRTFIQRKRSRTAEDDAFCDYLRSIAPKEGN